MRYWGMGRGKAAPPGQPAAPLRLHYCHCSSQGHVGWRAGGGRMPGRQVDTVGGKGAEMHTRRAERRGAIERGNRGKFEINCCSDWLIIDTLMAGSAPSSAVSGGALHPPPGGIAPCAAAAGGVGVRGTCACVWRAGAMGRRGHVGAPLASPPPLNAVLDGRLGGG